MIENDSERLEKRLYRDNARRGLMGGNDDAKMLNALLLHVIEEFF